MSAPGSPSPDTPLDRLISRRQLRSFNPWSDTTLWRKTRAGLFPAPVPHLSRDGRRLWRESDIRAWMDGRWAPPGATMCAPQKSSDATQHATPQQTIANNQALALEREKEQARRDEWDKTYAESLRAAADALRRETEVHGPVGLADCTEAAR